MKDLLKDKIGYIKYATQQCKQTGIDSKKANYAYDKLHKYYDAFLKNIPEATIFLKDLIQYPDSDNYVSVWAATHALGLNILVSDAVELLKEVASTPKSANLCRNFNILSAETILDQWNKGIFSVYGDSPK